MADLNISANALGPVPENCYLSVRVGGVQKLVRLRNAQNYKFPRPKDQRFAKIEVFKRVSSAFVDLEEPTNASQEVRFMLKGTSEDDVTMKFDVSKAGPVEPAKPVPQPVSPSSETGMKADKKRAAKDYLNQHALEPRLAEAMQALLRERPDEPMGFLATYLMGNVCASPKKMPPTPAAEKASPPPATSQAPAPAPAPAPAVGLVPFGAYYKAHCKTGGAQFLGKLYAKFPGFVAAQKAAAAAVPRFPMLEAGALDKLYSKFPAHRGASDKAKAASSPPAPVIQPVSALMPFQAYHAANFRSVPAPSLSNLFSKFPAPKRPAAAPSAGAAPAVAAAAPVAAKAAAFRLAPSVGTWLAKKPVMLPVASAPAAPAQVPEPASFKLKPSVGTWLASRPSPAAASGARAAQAAPTPAAQAPAAANFKLKPSVGTWLAARPSPAVQASAASAPAPGASASSGARSKFLPSVGSWLQQKPAPKLQAECLSIAGFAAPAALGPDERCELERALAEALMACSGVLEGEYLPLPASQSFAARTGGMTAAEELSLVARGFHFRAEDPNGRGIFVTSNGEAAVQINADGCHAKLLARGSGPDAAERLRALRSMLEPALQQDGYSLN